MQRMLILNFLRPSMYKAILKISFYLTIIPQPRMGYKSIENESKGQMGCWLRGYEGERNKWLLF